MKKLSFWVVCIIMLSLVVSGCSTGKVKTELPEGVNPLSIYYNKEFVQLGDTQESVEAITGTSTLVVFEFQEDNVERVSYREAEGADIDYNASGKVVALRITGKDWKMANGITIGTPKKEALSPYNTDLCKINEEQTVFIASFNEQFEQIPFDEKAPYSLRIETDEAGKVSFVVIQIN